MAVDGSKRSQAAFKTKRPRETVSPYTTTYQLRTFRVRDARLKVGTEIRATDAKHAVRLARAIYRTLDADKEHFVVLCLNQKNRLNGFKHVSTGTLSTSLIHPREVFIAALELRAAALIFVHNHPSGDPTPSPEDREITKRLIECGDLLGFRVLDHIILGRNKHYSFQERGML